MNHSAKGSGKLRTGVAVFVILLSGAGTGYAYVTPGSATSHDTATNKEWRQPGASDKKIPLTSAPSGEPASVRSKTVQDHTALLDKRKRSEIQTPRNAPRKQAQSLSDSDRKKLLVLLALWSIRS